MQFRNLEISKCIITFYFTNNYFFGPKTGASGTPIDLIWKKKKLVGTEERFQIAPIYKVIQSSRH